jgi:phage FluMu gp28-like protein
MAFHPYHYQAAFLMDRAPRRLVLKARQIGFSQVVALEAVHTAIFEPDSTILFVSRNQSLADNLLAYCATAMSGLGDDMPALTKQNNSELKFANGSHVLSLPATRSAGRGFAAKRVYLDEYAFQEYAGDIYRSVSPAVGLGGRLTVLSTPDGRGNHFYQLWAGIDGGDWSRHTVPWQQCPVYDAAWYERERPKYTAAQWASEYETDFIASGQAVFSAADITAAADGWTGLAEPAPERTYLTAWDIGRRRDATVGITLDITDDVHHVVAFERDLGLPFPVIQQRIEQRALAYRGRTYVESNGIGDPVIENLTLPVTPFLTTAKTKTQAITSLALAMENATFKHAIPQLALEQHLYQWQDEQLVQDCVMAAAIAVHQAARLREITDLDRETAEVLAGFVGR